MKIVENCISSVHYRVLFFGLLFLAFLSATLGDNVSEALVLSAYSAEFVSRFFVINGIILFFMSFFAISVIDTFNRAKLYLAFLLLYAASLVAIRLSHVLGDWVYAVLYSLSYTGKIMMFLFVWTLANDISDSRRGARDFPFIAAGGTLGAIVGTFSVPQLISLIAPHDLLWVWVGILLFSALFMRSVIRVMGGHFSQRRVNRRLSFRLAYLWENLTVLLSKPLLTTMAISYFFIFVIIFCQQYLFYAALRERFADAAQISGFLAYFKGSFLVITFFLQSFVAGAVTRYIGWIRLLIVLPVVFILSFATLTFIGTHDTVLFFQAVVAGMGIRIAVFDSFFSPNYQNVFSVFPDDIRGKGKLVIDGIVKPMAMAVSALLIAFLGASLSMALLLTVFSLISLGMILLLKRQYLFTTVQYLTQDDSPGMLQSFRESLSPEIGLELLDGIIAEEPAELKQCAVDLLAELDSDSSINHLVQWYPFLDVRMKAYTVSVLQHCRNRNVMPFIDYLFSYERNERVLANALITHWKAGGRREKLYRSYLDSDTPRLSGNAIWVLWRMGREEEYNLLKRLEERLFTEDERFYGSALWVIAHLEKNRYLQQMVEQFWFMRTTAVLRSRSLWKGLVQAAAAMESHRVFVELADMYQAVSEMQRRILVDEAARLIRRTGSRAFLLENQMLYSTYTTEFILKAVAKSGARHSSAAIARIEEFAREEYVRYGTALIALDFLKSLPRTAGVDYLQHLIRVEEQYLHFQNLVECAAIIDQSGAVRKLVDSMAVSRRQYENRVFDVIESAPSNRINRLILRLSDASGSSDAEFFDIDDILNLYMQSGLPVVRESALYFFRSMEDTHGSEKF
ncbi:MAG: hypothetical protein ACQEQV_01290 [Fibrobacterota bacterium]